MKRIRFKFKCAGCEQESNVDAPKPSYLESKVTKVDCNKCFSQLLVKVARQKGDPNQVAYRALKIWPSAELMAIFEARNSEKPLLSESEIELSRQRETVKQGVTE